MAGKSKSSNGSTKQPNENVDSAADAAEVIDAEIIESESDQASDALEQDANASEFSEVDQEDELSQDGVSEQVEPEADPLEEPVDAEVVPDVPGDAPGVIPAYAEPETAATEVPAPVVAPQPSRGGGVGAVIGGLVAGAIGFGAAYFGQQEGWIGQSVSTPEFDASGLEATIGEQTEALAALAADVEGIRAAAVPGEGSDQPIPDLAPLIAQIEALQSGVTETADLVSTLSTKTDELTERVASLEAQPAPEGGAGANAEINAQLEAFKAQLDQVTAEADARIAEAQQRVEAVEAEAAERAAAAERMAAVATVKAAMEDGSPFIDALALLEDVPEELIPVAEKGAPTLAALSEEFAPAARAALSQAQVVPENASTTEKFTAFLKRQTGARSLAPRDGDDADAVLSRAEAALASGDLSSALAELETLPEGARDAFSEWIAAAETRMSVMNAINSLENATN